MRHVRIWFLIPLLLMAAACAAPHAPRPGERGKQVLIFSHTTGYRHDAIAAAVPALSRLVRERGHSPVATESPEVFTPKSLEGYDAVILLSSTTDPKDPASEWLTGARAEALRAFVRKGGGIVAIHAASDSHYFSPWYGALIGGQFERHPAGTPKGQLTVANADHPATRSLPPIHERADEWYRIRNLDPKAQLLLTLDPVSIGEAGAPWPMSWARTEGRGRVFYTALGHTSESYADPYFLDHVRGGFVWAVRERERRR